MNFSKTARIFCTSDVVVGNTKFISLRIMQEPPSIFSEALCVFSVYIVNKIFYIYKYK